MAQDMMSHWVNNAKNAADNGAKPAGVKVIKNKPKTRGEMILDIADKICPSLMKLFDGVRDEHGMLVQAAHVRGIALNVAQDLVVNSRNQ